MALRQLVTKRVVARAPGSSGVQLGEAAARVLILKGAASVFAKRGARAASVADILTAAGISRRTFYRFYQNKEDVLEALYRLGTDELIESCRRAIAQESDPLKQIQGCIEAHLRNASEFGRLVFVLGGEAQRHESSVHPLRMQVHDTIVELLVASRLMGAGKRVDPLLYRALLLALEGVTRSVLAEGNEGRNVTEAGIERARKVMSRIATAALAGEGPGVTRLPMLDSK